MRPPKPEPHTCECGEQAGVLWNARPASGYPGWIRSSMCATCRGRWYHHGMTRVQYDAYMASGCAIAGCTRPASEIDHDHAICPQSQHSCERCRRGPLCRHHNTRVISLLDDLRAGKFTAELAYIGWELECAS